MFKASMFFWGILISAIVALVSQGADSPKSVLMFFGTMTSIVAAVTFIAAANRALSKFGIWFDVGVCLLGAAVYAFISAGLINNTPASVFTSMQGVAVILAAIAATILAHRSTNN